jgi:hypothetical protein
MASGKISQLSGLSTVGEKAIAWNLLMDSYSIGEQIF